MNINSDLNLLFIHVPKNAGKSIMKAFEIGADPVLKRSVVESVATERASLHPEGRYKSEYIDKLIKFAVVRNPWDRIVSLYHFRKRENDLYNMFPDCNVFGGDKTLPDGSELSFKEWIMSPHSKGAGGFPFWERIHTDPDINNRRIYHPDVFERKDYFYQMTKTQNNEMYNSEGTYMWMTHFLDWIQQIHFITRMDGTLFVDEVLRFERIEEDLEKLCDKYNLPQVDLPRLNSNPRKSKNYVDFYDDELVSYIQDYIQDDIEHLGYKFGD